ncbi:MAG: response regulator [Saprospiraceae bacterium]
MSIAPRNTGLLFFILLYTVIVNAQPSAQSFIARKDAGGKDQNLEIISYRQLDGQTGKMLVLTEQLKKEGSIVLKPHDKAFVLEVGFLDKKPPIILTYAYRLKGLDHEWRHHQQGEIRIYDLPAGKYEMEVKAQLANGHWLPDSLTLSITVQQPFYGQTWFKLVSLLFFLFLIGGWIHLRNVQNKSETLRLEARVAMRTSELQRDKQIIEQQAEALRALDAMKSRFFANISHELRTPLTLILGPVSHLLARQPADTRDITSLTLIKQHAQKLLDLVNEILDLSKIESGKLQLEKKVIPIVPFLKRLVESFESLAQYQDIQLDFNCDILPETCFLLDGPKLEKIVTNLISNALKFTPCGGQVVMNIQKKDQCLLLEVVDNGTGIHPDDLPYVFDRFYQSGQLNYKAEGGTGIGLALSMELAHLMQAKLWVQSDYGKGAHFFLEIPYQEANPSPAEMVIPAERKEWAGFSTNELLSASAPSSSAKRQKVLVVEDNQDMQLYLKVILEPHFQLVLAKNGEEALLVLEDNASAEIDLIISDVMMPVMDGFTLLQELKRHAKWQLIPVIMLTARAAEEDRMAALRVGVDDYILKPFQPEELLIRSQNILKNDQVRKKYLQSLAVLTTVAASDQVESTLQKQIAPPGLSPQNDAIWLAKLKENVKQHLHSFDFNIDELAYQLAISRRHLSRKVKSLTGLTVNQYIQEIRLQEARHLLESEAITSVKAVAYRLGMKDVKYFSKLYIQRFGKRPSDFL